MSIELLLLQHCAVEIADLAGGHAALFVLGGAAGPATRLLMRALTDPVSCMPIDATAPPQHLPRVATEGRALVFIPGPVMDRIAPDAVASWLHRLADAAGPGALLVLSATVCRHGLRRLLSTAHGAGWLQRQLWTDAHAQCAVQVFERAASGGALQVGP